MAHEFGTNEWITEANAEIKVKGCPRCKSPEVKVERQLVAKEIGTFSLAGMQDKVSAVSTIVLECEGCGLRARLSQDDD